MLPGKSHPLEIPRHLREALRRIARNRYRRGRHGWTTPSAPDLKFHTVTELKLKNLVSIRHGPGADRLALSQLGKEVAGSSATQTGRTVH